MHNKAGLKLEEERFEGPGGKMFAKSTKLLSNFRPLDEPSVLGRGGGGGYEGSRGVGWAAGRYEGGRAD